MPRFLNGGQGSVSIVGAVSPAGGDFTEPVTQNTLRMVKVFWALDSKLTQRRHFPSINWLDSYSLYDLDLEPWFVENVSPDWNKNKRRAMAILQENAELEEIVMLVGSDALPEDQQVTLEVARMIINFWLAQSAFHPVDTFSPYKKQFDLLEVHPEVQGLRLRCSPEGHTCGADHICSIQGCSGQGKTGSRV